MMIRYVVVALLFVLGCGRPHQTDKGTATTNSKEDTVKVHDILQKYSARWMQIPGVIGTGEGLDDNSRPCIKVFVESRTAEIEKRIPRSVEGIAVIIEETGTVTIHK